MDKTYARILRGIPHEYKQNAIRILQFLVFSERPLQIEEAVDIIAVDTEGDPQFNPKNQMPDPQEVSRYCSSLVVVVPIKNSPYEGYIYMPYENNKGAVLQLAHFSVKEYLMSNQLNKHLTQYFQEMVARALIAAVCLAYLLHLDQDLLVHKIRGDFPLAQYCTQYWMGHAAVGKGENKVLHRLTMEFFLHRKGSYINWYYIYDPDQPWKNEYFWLQNNMFIEAEKPADALYYASFGGLTKAVKCLIKHGADVNAQGGHYGTALYAAAAGGHEKIVQILLDKGANVNT